MTDHHEHEHDNVVHLNPDDKVELQEYSCEYASAMTAHAMETIAKWQKRFNFTLDEALVFFRGALRNFDNVCMHHVPNGADLEAITEAVIEMRRNLAKAREHSPACDTEHEED